MSLIMDSGAFSAWSKGADINFEEYVKYLVKYQEGIDVIVNLDVIPATPGQKKISQAEIDRSAEEGWANYETLIAAGLPRKKVVHVFHQNEDWKWLEKMVKTMPYIGLSPANDRTTEEKIVFLDECMKYVCDKNGIPKVKFHGFAVTSHRLMERYPWWSVDSSSWVVQGGLGTIYVPKWEKRSKSWNFKVCHNVSVTKTAKNKDSYCHLPEVSRNVVERYLKDVHGLGLGHSVFKKVEIKSEIPEGWKKVQKNTVINLGYSLEEDQILIENKEVLGVQNDDKIRYYINAYFINEFQKTVKPWPWAFKVKKPQKLFV